MSVVDRDPSQFDVMIEVVLAELCHCAPLENMIFSFAGNRGIGREDTEDLFQDSLARLVINLLEKKYKQESNLENYLFGIFKFNVLNFVRNRKTKPKLDELPADDRSHPAEAATDIALMDNESNNLLWEIVRKVSGHCPDYLSYWATGLSYREISKKMEVSEKRVGKNLGKCRERLRALLRDDDDLYQQLLGSIDLDE